MFSHTWDSVFSAPRNLCGHAVVKITSLLMGEVLRPGEQGTSLEVGQVLLEYRTGPPGSMPYVLTIFLEAFTSGLLTSLALDLVKLSECEH